MPETNESNSENRSLDIAIEIRITGTPPYPALVVSESIEVLNQVIAEEDAQEFRFLIDELPGLSPLDRDGLRYRYSQLNSRSTSNFAIRTARDGSLVFEGLIVLGSIWLLDKAFGDLISDTVKRTDMYRSLQRLLLQRIGGKPRRIVQRLQGDYRYRQLPSGEVVLESRNGGPLIAMTINIDSPAVRRVESPSAIIERGLRDE